MLIAILNVIPRYVKVHHTHHYHQISFLIDSRVPTSNAFRVYQMALDIRVILGSMEVKALLIIILHIVKVANDPPTQLKYIAHNNQGK